MKVTDALLPEFDQEMATTRKVLERVPDDKLSFKPHAKSFDMGKLASHVVEIVTWVPSTIGEDSINMEGYPPSEPMKSRAELLSAFDKNVAAARASIAGAKEEIWVQPWSLRSGDRIFFTMPKLTVMRGFVMNHGIHHRAQLALYLRMTDVPVPSMYGPSADEQTF